MGKLWNSFTTRAWVGGGGGAGCRRGGAGGWVCARGGRGGGGGVCNLGKSPGALHPRSSSSSSSSLPAHTLLSLPGVTPLSVPIHPQEPGEPEECYSPEVQRSATALRFRAVLQP